MPNADEVKAILAQVEEKAAPPVSVTDTMPAGAARLGTQAATPINAATMRFLQAISTVEPELEKEDQALFALYCRVQGASKDGRRKLWRLARAPATLWDDFLAWMEVLSVEELEGMMREHFPDWMEVDQARRLTSPDGEPEDAGGSEGNATGSPS